MSSGKTLHLTFLLLTACLVLAFPRSDHLAHADIFKLTGGGQVEGHWVDRQSPPVKQYEIELRGGGRLVLDASAVEEVIPEDERESAYRELVAETASDVPGHWRIAEWCDEQGLHEKRRYHLRRVLRLDPDHVEARRALGYTYVRGQWVTHDEFMRAEGYVRYRGGWELPQKVALLEARRNRQAACRQWYRQLSLWRRDMGTAEYHEPIEKIAKVDDPMAVPALVRLLMEEKLRPIRMLYVQTLAQIGTPEAEHCLLNFSLTDYDTELVHGICDKLVETRLPSVHKELVKILQSESNYLVNRAATVLGRLGTEEDFIPLIDALITQHWFPEWNKQEKKWELVRTNVRNRQVHDTLLALSGTTGYGYDKKAWKHWNLMRNKAVHAHQSAKTATLRRDGK